MNIVEKALADVEARRAEVLQARHTGHMLTSEEIDAMEPEEEAAAVPEAPPKTALTRREPIRPMSTTTPAKKPQKAAEKPKGLQGRNLLAAFSSSLPKKTVDFQIDGKPASVTLRRMGQEDLNHYQGLAMLAGMTAQDAGRAAEAVELATEANRYLVAHSLVDYLLWTRQEQVGGELGEWVQAVPPETASQRAEFVERILKDAEPELWRGLIYEAEVVNGLEEDSRGN